LHGKKLRLGSFQPRFVGWLTTKTPHQERMAIRTDFRAVMNSRRKVSMERTLRVLLQRDPVRDRQDNQVSFEGYEILWPDGRPLSLGFDAFCRQGQRLLGLGRRLAGRREQLIDMIYVPLASREDDLTRLPGHRVRRFCLRRNGREGRLHFLDGTATAIVLNLDHDEPRVLDWLGLNALDDGASLWFDLAARSVEPVDVPCPERSSAKSTSPTVPCGVLARS
jgi:hypothetical protein